MKNLRIACFVCALANLVSFSVGIILSSRENSERADAGILYLYPLLIIAMVILTVLLARQLNRSGFGWGVFSLFFPWIAGFIIAFLGKAEYKPKPTFSWGGTGGYTGTYVAGKSCSACGQSVPVTSMVGQRCPHCGAYWSTETQRRI